MFWRNPAAFNSTPRSSQWGSPGIRQIANGKLALSGFQWYASVDISARSLYLEWHFSMYSEATRPGKADSFIVVQELSYLRALTREAPVILVGWAAHGTTEGSTPLQTIPVWGSDQYISSRSSCGPTAISIDCFHDPTGPFVFPL